MKSHPADERPTRKCSCSGHCGPPPNQISRRDFVTLLGTGAAAAFLAEPAWGSSFELPAADLERWRRSLFEPAQPRRYSSAKHTDARMHLGGIGTGNFEIGVDAEDLAHGNGHVRQAGAVAGSFEGHDR